MISKIRYKLETQYLRAKAIYKLIRFVLPFIIDIARSIIFRWWHIRERLDEVNIHNATLEDQDMNKHMKETDGMQCDPRVHGWKRLIKLGPQILGYFLKFHGYPKITKPTTRLIHDLTEKAHARTLLVEKQMQKDLDEMREEGKAAPTDWTSHAILSFIRPIGAILMAISEGDPFYERWIADKILMIASWGEKNRCFMDMSCKTCDKPTQLGFNRDGEPIILPRLNGFSGWIRCVLQEQNAEAQRLNRELIERYTEERKANERDIKSRRKKAAA